MGYRTIRRSIDGGAAFVVHENDPPPPCGPCVCVETRFDASATGDAIELSLRRADQHDGGPAHVDGVRATARISLTTGLCAPADAEAERLFVEHPWLHEAFVARLEWLRERARRGTAQRDRSSCFAALTRAGSAAMIPYDDLFPHDWDLLVRHDGHSYWAIDHYCPNAACTCEDIVVELHQIDRPEALFVGQLRIDLTIKPLRPKASSVPAAKLFEPLWSAHGADLLLRYAEVRRAIRAHAAVRPAADARRGAPPARNAPCPCGSGKKYKRCCVDRDLQAARSEPATSRALR